MSGHSKWHSIRHKKAIIDSKRGAKFTKLIKEIQVAVRMGGSDPNGNPRLRTAIQAARDVSMPKDNIERAIKKGSGELGSVSYTDFVFEGYGQAGVAILVEGTTDNMNRTAPEIRFAFSKYGGAIGEPGSVNWMFKRKGVVMVAAEGADEEKAMEAALEAGAEDFENVGESFRILTDPGQIEAVRAALEGQKFKVESSEVEMLPDNFINLADAEEAKKLLKLLEVLEEHDDVRAIWANHEIDDSIADAVEA